MINSINNYKYFIFLIFLFFLILFPQYCNADIYIGPIFGSAPLLFVTFLALITLIEWPFIRELKGTERKAFYVALGINLVTAVLGVGIVLVGYFSAFFRNLISFLFENEFLSLFSSFFFSFLIETILLIFFYKKESGTRIGLISFSMNILSYSVLILFFFFTYLIDFIVFPILLFLFLRTLLKMEKQRFSKEQEKILWLIILIILLAILLFFFNQILTKSRPTSDASDARIISAINQIRTVMTYLCYNDSDGCNVFNCLHEDMRILCEDIAKHNPDKVNPVIVSDQKNACIYSKLNKTEEEDFDIKKGLFRQKQNYWYCADSTGIAGRTNINPGDLGYCVSGSAVCPPVEED